jgi:hypothetical protein
VPAGQKHQAVELLAGAHFRFSPVGFKGMTPKRRKRRGESVPSPEPDKAEGLRAVLTMREIGVVASAAAETTRHHRQASGTAPTSVDSSGWGLGRGCGVGECLVFDRGEPSESVIRDNGSRCSSSAVSIA